MSDKESPKFREPTKEELEQFEKDYQELKENLKEPENDAQTKFNKLVEDLKKFGARIAYTHEGGRQEAFLLPSDKLPAAIVQGYISHQILSRPQRRAVMKARVNYLKNRSKLKK